MARQRRLESTEDYKRALKQKYGLGEGKSYKPWLRVQDVKSRGNSGKIEGLKSGRAHHTLSEYESCFFYLAEFSDTVIDIREQFPLLPLNLTVKISEQLGVKHPTNPTTKSLNIITTDFLLTRETGSGVYYEAYSVKPESELANKRVAEKLDVERVFWQLLEIPFYIFTMPELASIKSKNIEWFTSPFRKGVDFPKDTFFRATSLLQLGTIFLEDICKILSNHLEIDIDNALVLLKLMLAKKYIHADINIPIAESGLLKITKISAFDLRQSYAS